MKRKLFCLNLFFSSSYKPFVFFLFCARLVELDELDELN